MVEKFDKIIKNTSEMKPVDKAVCPKCTAVMDWERNNTEYISPYYYCENCGSSFRFVEVVQDEHGEKLVKEKLKSDKYGFIDDSKLHKIVVIAEFEKLIKGR